MIAAGALAANTLLSFTKGYTTTAAIGGADMRKSSPKADNPMFIANKLFSCCHHCAQRV
jgi:hypothetical protein